MLKEKVGTLLGPEDIIQSDSRLIVHQGLPLLGSSLGGLLQVCALLYLVSPHEGLQGDLGALNEHAPPHRVLPPQCIVYLLKHTCLHAQASDDLVWPAYQAACLHLHAGCGDPYPCPTPSSHPQPRKPEEGIQ